MVRTSRTKLIAAAMIPWLVLPFLAAPACAELLLFYDFNTATNPDAVLDVSGNGNDADVIGAEYTPSGGGRTGAAGDRAMDFLGNADPAYIDMFTAADGALDSITENDAVTISMWLFGADEQPVDGTVVWFAGTDQRQMVIHVPWGDSVIYFDSAGCDSCLFIAEPDETKWKGQWNHYVFLKGGERAAIYQNGELLAETDGRPPFDIITTARFGTFANDSFPYAGLMDDIGIWDEAISDELIACLAAGNTPAGCGGLPGDFDGDRMLTANDVNLLITNIAKGPQDLKFDLTADGKVDTADLTFWVKDRSVRNSWMGDANLDGEFNSTDFVQVFQRGEYEDTVADNSGWDDGDWNADLDFDSSDFVAAFQDGGFEKGPRAAVSAVPEPSSYTLALLGLFLATRRVPRRRRWDLRLP